jgi:type IV pilus biogenesis protein CpaD/CtpE
MGAVRRRAGLAARWRQWRFPIDVDRRCALSSLHVAFTSPNPISASLGDAPSTNTEPRQAARNRVGPRLIWAFMLGAAITATSGCVAPGSLPDPARTYPTHVDSRPYELNLSLAHSPGDQRRLAEWVRDISGGDPGLLTIQLIVTGSAGDVSSLVRRLTTLGVPRSRIGVVSANHSMPAAVRIRAMRHMAIPPSCPVHAAPVEIDLQLDLANLAAMVAHPADLIRHDTAGPARGSRATDALAPIRRNVTQGDAARPTEPAVPTGQTARPGQ